MVVTDCVEERGLRRRSGQAEAEPVRPIQPHPRNWLTHTTHCTQLNMIRQPFTAALRSATRLPRTALPTVAHLPTAGRTPHSLSPLASSSRLASSAAKPLQRTKEIKDEQIPHSTVCFVDPATSSLSGPAQLADLLAALDRTRFSLQLVDPSHEPPIVRIIDKKAQYTKEKALKQKSKDKEAESKGGSGPAKEVQISYSTTKHDLGHKLTKAKELLDKRGKVNVILVSKKGAPALAAGAKQDVVSGVKEAFEGVGTLIRPETQDGGKTTFEFKKA